MRRVCMENDPSGELRLGHLFEAPGLPQEEVVVIRLTLNPGGLATRAGANRVRPSGVQTRTRPNNKLGRTRPQIWLNFLAT
jgi:hypothetical protein